MFDIFLTLVFFTGALLKQIEKHQSDFTTMKQLCVQFGIDVLGMGTTRRAKRQRSDAPEDASEEAAVKAPKRKCKARTKAKGKARR